jgi:hypothetical protein
MANVKHISGVEALLTKLRRTDQALERNFEKGLIAGGLYLQRESQKVCPVEYGNLHNSATTRKVAGKGRTADIVVAYGHNAEYAVYVHERTELHHREGKQAKFLEGPARKYRDRILSIIKNVTAGFRF